MSNYFLKQRSLFRIKVYGDLSKTLYLKPIHVWANKTYNIGGNIKLLIHYEILLLSFLKDSSVPLLLLSEKYTLFLARTWHKFWGFFLAS